MWVEGRKSVAGVLWQTGMRLTYMVWGRGGSDKDLQLVYLVLWAANLVCSQGLLAGLHVGGWVNGMSRGKEFGGEDLCDSLERGKEIAVDFLLQIWVETGGLNLGEQKGDNIFMYF